MTTPAERCPTCGRDTLICHDGLDNTGTYCEHYRLGYERQTQNVKALADALEDLVRGLPGTADTDYSAPPGLKAAVDRGFAALRSAGRLP